jgi:divalent metal cation (Fe/Co/Zn/Cd) transporter
MKDAQFAMRLSLIVGIAMLLGKTTAYFTTHSAAVFSDAAESLDSANFSVRSWALICQSDIG